MHGRTTRRLAASILMTTLIAAHFSDGKAQVVAASSPITGTWRGGSVCALKDIACHDETNVYRFVEVAGETGKFSGTGFKVVDGNEISMGTLVWQYDAEGHTLISNNPRGVFRLVVDGDKIEGTLTLMPEGTIYRRIHLTKVN